MPIPYPGADDFSTTIDNPFFTLRPGTTFVYENLEGGTTDRMTVTRDTVVVDGVTCVVVHDTAYANGLVVEDTFDWYAQDSAGNVWYFGEDTREYEPGNPDPINTNGSWEAGVDGALPGIIMLSDPEVGETYQQEFAEGIAEDYATVLALDATASSPYGTFDGMLKTEDVNPLDPSVENKFYAEGVGTVLTTDAEGAREELTEVIVRGTGGNDNLLGYAGGDGMSGGNGADLMRGGDGNDTMDGDAGDDDLRGNAGHDDLDGGAGNDMLRGGAGADTFIFGNLHDGIASLDSICDYRTAQVDVIDLRHGVNSIAGEAMVDGVWQLTLKGDGDMIALTGVTDANADGHIVDDLFII